MAHDTHAPPDLTAAERAEAVRTVREGRVYRVWRDGRIHLLATLDDVDALYPPTRRRRSDDGEGWWT